MKSIIDILSYSKGNIHNFNLKDKVLPIEKDVLAPKSKYTITILALGDVGSNLLIGLYLLGGEIIDKIQIWDIDEKVKRRFEMEINQISCEDKTFPDVVAIDEEQLFDCDVFLFCASASVPSKITENMDIRMMQLEKNKLILAKYCNIANLVNYNNIFAIVSDPVDPLCKFAETCGINSAQIKGFGLGVMMSRARYFAKKEKLDYEKFISEGRAYGPHGKDLIIANSILNYDDELSKKLTKLTVEANIKVRDLGFKPFIAPAMSSGALSLISYLKGEWTYSSVPFGNVYLGIRNRRYRGNIFVENEKIHEKLYTRIINAIKQLNHIKL